MEYSLRRFCISHAAKASTPAQRRVSYANVWKVNLSTGDLKSSKAIYAKGFAFLLMGITAAILILLETASMRIGLLLAICVWAFCRFYYFAFYVIEHYVDDQFRFAGLIDFARYLIGRPRA